MESNIISAIIGAAGVIIAAAIGKFFQKKRNISKFSKRKLFIIGMNVAKIGWSKISPTQESQTILISTKSLLIELQFPQNFVDKLDSFANKAESIKELQVSLPRLKKMIGMEVATKFGKKGAGFYNIGFNLINISPLLEMASINPDGAGKAVAKSFKDIEKEANTLDLPMKELKVIRKFIKIGVSQRKGEMFDMARSILMEVGQQYIDLLEKK